MTPEGLFFLVLFTLLLIAVIAFGSAWIKAGEARAREERQKLKALKEAREQEKRGA